MTKRAEKKFDFLKLEEKGGKLQKRLKKVKRKYSALIGLALVCVGALILYVYPRHYEPVVVSKPTLEKIINLSDLNTYEAAYNGIASVTDEEKPERVRYYVSYDAKVNAGIDIKQIHIDLDESTKTITVRLPKVKITDVNVVLSSLDYLFVQDKYNTENVSAEAYRCCIEDVKRESASENALFEVAEQNARNFIEALLRPLIESVGNQYQLEIV